MTRFMDIDVYEGCYGEWTARAVIEQALYVLFVLIVPSVGYINEADASWVF